MGVERARFLYFSAGCLVAGVMFLLYQTLDQSTWDAGRPSLRYLFSSQRNDSGPHSWQGTDSSSVPAPYGPPSQKHSSVDTRNVSVQTTCKRVRNLYYVKVHKTASSTLITLLYRMVRNYNLTVYPVTGDSYPGDISTRTFRRPEEYQGMVYNLFGEHAKFNAKAAAARMPSDTQYIASIRYPIGHLRSLFVEFGVAGRAHIKGDDPAVVFLSDLETYHSRASYIKNFQSRTLGYTGNSPEDIRVFIEGLRQRFSLVIIAEYFDESLVILRRKFCWEVADIAYTVLRERHYKHKNAIPPADVVAIHREYSPADYELYTFFVKELMSSISEQQQTFWDELFVFRNIKENIFMYCDSISERLGKNPKGIYKMATSHEREEYDPAPWGEKFAITAIDCAMMKLKTLVQRNIMKIRQFPKLCNYPIQYTPKLSQGIKWTGKNGKSVMMHRAYCHGNRTEHGIPIDVLAEKDAYLWM